MSWKQMILGERMPAKEDSPELMQRHDTEVAAGMRAARWLRIDLQFIPFTVPRPLD